MSPLTDTGAGAILASIKEGLGRGEDGAQKAPRSIQPKKRRHIGSEVEQFPMETVGIATVQTGRRKQDHHIIYSAANNIYYRNSVHVLQSTD